MYSMIYAGLVEALGAFALWSIFTDFKAGSTTNRGMTIELKENPGGFYFVQVWKAAVVCFAAATLLHGLGLIGDPVTWIHQTFPFLKIR
jgi:hypothetical protein